MDIMFGEKGKVVGTLFTSNVNMAWNPKKLNNFAFRTEMVDKRCYDKIKRGPREIERIGI